MTEANLGGQADITTAAQQQPVKAIYAAIRKDGQALAWITLTDPKQVDAFIHGLQKQRVELWGKP